MATAQTEGGRKVVGLASAFACGYVVLLVLVRVLATGLMVSSVGGF